MSIDYQGVQPPQPAGWHADPTRRHQYRYFDGAAWTDHVADAGIQSDDPMDRPPPPSDPWQAEPTTTADEPNTAPPAAQQAPPPQQTPERPPPMPLVRPDPAGGPYLQDQAYRVQAYQVSQGTQPQAYQAYPPGAAPPQWGWQPVTQDARWHEPTPAGLSMIEAVKRVLSKYAHFHGRASRSEYWWFILAVNLAFLAAWIVVGGLASLGGQDAAVAAGTGFGVVLLMSLGIAVPALAVGVRRLHDTDKSGWFMLLGLIPYIGGLIVAVLMALRGTPWPNQYGQPAAAAR